MIFFKQIKDEKLRNRAFERHYQKECHICLVTIQVVALLENRKQELAQILKQTQIDPEDYDALKKGDDCNPDLVFRLCRHLDLPTDNWFPKCPKRRPPVS